MIFYTCINAEVFYDVCTCYEGTVFVCGLNTRVVPNVMSKLFLHANWEQQTKESTVVDGTSCCVVLECLVTSIACNT